jgi:hypothetical protein
MVIVRVLRPASADTHVHRPVSDDKKFIFTVIYYTGVDVRVRGRGRGVRNIRPGPRTILFYLFRSYTTLDMGCFKKSINYPQYAQVPGGGGKGILNIPIRTACKRHTYT